MEPQSTSAFEVANETVAATIVATITTETGAGECKWLRGELLLFFKI
jgi:hypothetical protein